MFSAFEFLVSKRCIANGFLDESAPRIVCLISSEYGFAPVIVTMLPCIIIITTMPRRVMCSMGDWEGTGKALTEAAERARKSSSPRLVDEVASTRKQIEAIAIERVSSLKLDIVANCGISGIFLHGHLA